MKKLKEEKKEIIEKAIKLLQSAGFHVPARTEIRCEGSSYYNLGDENPMINQRFTGVIEYDIPEIYFEDA